MNQKFRVHHILCTALYVGEGYSGVFCENMTAIVSRLRANPDEMLQLVAEPDMICEKCPNKTASGECSQDANHVEVKDRLLLKALGLKENEPYSYRQLLEQASETITQEIFENSCSGCRWYRKGLCSYDKLFIPSSY